MKGKPGRHVPAFVLLMIAKRPAYGLQILNKLREDMPYCLLDSAAVYRALNLLEKSGAVQVIEECKDEEQTTDGGTLKKYYGITQTGQDELKNLHDDIQKRYANLSFFIKSYSDLEGVKDDK